MVGAAAAGWVTGARSGLDASAAVFRAEWICGERYDVLPFHGYLSSLPEFTEPIVGSWLGSVGERVVVVDASWLDVDVERLSHWSTSDDKAEPSVWSLPATPGALCWCVDEMPFNSWIAASTSRDSVLLSSRWEHFALVSRIRMFDAAVVRGVRERFVHDVRSHPYADEFDLVLRAYGLA